MSGKILKLARHDIKKIVTGGGFEEDFVFFNPTRSQFSFLKGLHSKHWLRFASDGSTMNAKNAHLSVPEESLNEAGFETRGKNGNISLRNYFVLVPDSTGIYKKYVVTECFPSETTGLIVFILSDAEFEVSQEVIELINDKFKD